jgi:hypothetical protein
MEKFRIEVAGGANNIAGTCDIKDGSVVCLSVTQSCCGSPVGYERVSRIAASCGTSLLVLTSAGGADRCDGDGSSFVLRWHDSSSGGSSEGGGKRVVSLEAMGIVGEQHQGAYFFVLHALKLGNKAA